MSNLDAPSTPDLSPGGDTFVQTKPLKRPPSPRTSCIYLTEYGDNVLGLVLRERATTDTYPIVALQNHPALLRDLESLRLLSALSGDGIDWAADAPLLTQSPFDAGIVIHWRAVAQCEALVDAILDSPACGGVVVTSSFTTHRSSAQRAWVDFGVHGQASASGSLQNVLNSVSKLWLIQQRQPHGANS